jgi:simple sugar transport system ATP-binding protein
MHWLTLGAVYMAVSTAPAILRCAGLTKYFGAVCAISDVSLELREGEILALMGDNGAGKSTLVRIISGVEQPDRGEIWFGNEQVSHLTPRSARGLGIETVHQHLALCDNLSGAENVTLGREPVRFRLGPFAFYDWRKANEESRRALDEVGAAVPDLTSTVRRLSGGQRQALAIARAVASGGRVIIFDEPTAALGIKQTMGTFKLIRQVAARGVAVVLISHSIRDVLQVADRIVAMRHGRVVFDLACSEVTEERLIESIAGTADEDIA